MAALASVALTTARTLLNDDQATLWTDVVLMPKLQQAYRELEAKLRINAASIMKGTTFTTITAGVLVYPTIASIKEPIRLWEKAVGDPDSSYAQMTEYDPLPTLAQVATLIYWQWDGSDIQFLGSSANRVVRVSYWRTLAEPTANSSSLFFTDAELFLAPRTAALAAGSVGEKDKYDVMSAVADGNIDMVIQANRGRQAPPATARP